MPEFLKNFDGTGRTPRAEQVEALTWLSDNWDKSKFFSILAGTGVGKSGIAVAIQQATGAAVIAPNNNLLDQYIDTYPGANFLKGRAYYKCDSGITCEDRKDLKMKPCDGCPYLACRKAALKAEPTVFNPISYHYLSQSEKSEQFPVLVVDEAHLLLEMLSLLVSEEFRHAETKYPPYESHAHTADWLKEHGKTLGRLSDGYRKTGDDKKAARLKAQQLKCEGVEYGLREYPANYAVHEREGFHRGKPERHLVIEPINTPGYIVQQFFDGFEKVILMSATLPENRVKSMARNEKVLSLDVGTPIPVANRPILVRNGGLTAQSDPSSVATWIKKQLEPGKNTICHTTYKMGKALHALFPGSLYHTPETKGEVMKQFKTQGGLWFAAACSEGVDLPGDECRLNLIPVLPFENVGSPLVKARLKAPGGQKRYASDCLTTFIQQAGRSTRGVEDFSTTVCGDGRLAGLIGTARSDCSKSFLPAVRFT